MRGEGKFKGIGNELRAGSGFCIDQVVIKAGDPGIGEHAREMSAGVTGSGTDIQKREAIICAGDSRDEFGSSRITAKAFVDANKVSQIHARLVGVGVVQQFRLNVAVLKQNDKTDAYYVDSEFSTVAT